MSESRIRWGNVAKLGAGATACVALAVGLPALLRRPEPPSLAADVGFAPAARGPLPAGALAREPRGDDRGPGRDRAHRAGRASPPEPVRHQARSAERPSGAVKGAPRPSPAPSPAPRALPTSPAPLAPSPPPAAPAEPPARPPQPVPAHPLPPPPGHRSEFGFER
jgi:hypothetical protein